MKRKLLSVVLAVSMVFALTACSSEKTPQAETEAAEENQVEEAEEGTAAGETKEPEETASDWVPEKDITIVVPYEAGGNSDIPTRVFAKYMAKYADVDISITNITGAGGRTGAKEVMEADADGYTYLLQSSGFVMQYALGIADFSYEDFEPVGYMLDSSMALVVSKDSPYNSLEDLIAAAKENPNSVKFGTVTGTLPLFAALYLEAENDITFNKVDLGTGAKAPELLSNRIDCYADGFGAVKQYVDSGDFKCLVIYSGNRAEGYDEIPCLTDLGYENFDYLKQNFGLWAPRGTDAAAVAYVNNLMKLAAEDPECVEELQNLSYAPLYTTVEEYTATMETVYSDFSEAAKSVVQ